MSNAKKAAARKARRERQKTKIQVRPAKTSGYVRIRLTGLLTSLSPLHIGTGELVQAQDTDSATEALPALSFMKDHRGLPYIPGSSLRGLLRQQARISWGEEDALFKRVFGLSKGDADNTDSTQTGQLRVMDAPIFLHDLDDHGKISVVEPKEQSQRAEQVIQNSTTLPRVSIDPVTQTAIEHHLFSLDVILENTKFELTLELENIGQEQLTLDEMARINQLLERLSHASELQLGKGKSYGQGLFSWRCNTQNNHAHIQGVSHAHLLQWLKGDERFPDFGSLWKWQPLPDIEADYTSEWTSIPLYIKPQSAFLVNALTETRKKQDKSESGSDSLPAAVFQKTKDGKPVIPGSSLKGLLRGHCRKILSTIQQGNDKAKKDKSRLQELETMLEELFGSTGRTGVIRVQSAIASDDASEHTQYFNAVDRFTGGVKDGALYHVKAARCERLNSRFLINTEFLKDNAWAQALLVMMFRDALEGDLSIGWGKSKGFGMTRFELDLPQVGSDSVQTEKDAQPVHTCITDWPQLAEAWPDIPGIQTDVHFSMLPKELLNKLCGEDKGTPPKQNTQSDQYSSETCDTEGA